MHFNFGNFNWPIWDTNSTNFIKAFLLSNDSWSRGRIIEKFEKSFANYCNCKYCLLVNSGTSALKLALMASGVGPGDEVILPGLTWPSTAIAVMECGAKAVIVDIEISTFGISPEAVRKNITRNTKAVIAVHLYCSTANLTKLKEIAIKNKLLLIEDACQAIGGLWNNKQLGTIGDVGAFSFQEKKPLTCGEGGCIVTNNESIFKQAFALRDHGNLPNNSKLKRCGSNYRIASVNAAILMVQLEKLNTIINLEDKNGSFLAKEINKIPNLIVLKRRNDLTIQNFYSFCFRLLTNELKNKKNEIIKDLTSTLGIKFSSSYPPLNDKDFFDPFLEYRYNGLFKFTDLKKCNQAFKESIRFPHQFLLCSQEQIENIALGMSEYFMKTLL